MIFGAKGGGAKLDEKQVLNKLVSEDFRQVIDTSKLQRLQLSQEVKVNQMI